MILRLASKADLLAVCKIYDRAHDMEEQGLWHTGWIRGIYPERDIAEESLAEGSLYVVEIDGAIAATARINQIQGDEYGQGRWSTC